MARQIIAHQYFISDLIVWIKLLIRNRGVNFKYIPKALVITFFTIVGFPFQLINLFLIKLKERKLTKVEDPIFIVGHWRGGTTYLHYLLAKDDRLGYLSYYQAFAPNLSTVGGSLFKKFLAVLMPPTRPQDNIALHMDFPMEEENTIAAFSMYSASHSFFFPNNENFYKKFVLFEGTSSEEKSKWKNAYRSMLRQISTKFPGKQLLIKNPHNTGRVKELLEIYPNAKFIHIYRNPYEVFPSTYLMYERVVRTQFLQNYSDEQVRQKIVYYYKTMMKKYFEERSEIPADQIIEVKYEEFEKTPIEHIKAIYNQFGMDLKPDLLQKMIDYVDSLKGYKKNRHSIEDPIKSQIEKDWKFAFDEMNYEIHPKEEVLKVKS